MNCLFKATLNNRVYCRAFNMYVFNPKDDSDQDNSVECSKDCDHYSGYPIMSGDL